jgi:TonB family protein
MRFSLSLLLLALLMGAPALAKDASAPAGYDEEMRQISLLLNQKQDRAAIAALERLDQLSGGSCGNCLVALASTSARVGERPAAAATARRAIDRVSDPDQLAYAYATLGFSLLDSKAGPRELAEAETALRRTLELDKRAWLQSWGLKTLDWILFHRQHYDDMVALGREYLDNHPGGPDEDVARSMICIGRNLGNIPGPETHVPAESRGQKVLRPTPLYNPKPGYTQDALDAGIEGTMIVEATLDTEGCVVNTDILQGLDPDLDQHVLDILRYWAFRPATLAGEPVKVHYSLTLNFRKEPKAP